MTTTHARIAVITGGSRGLGRSMALHLADHGTDVIFTYRAAAAEAEAVVAAIAAKGRRAQALPLDVGASAGFPAFVEAVAATLAGWGRDRFAGVHATIADTTEEQLDELYRVHLRAPFVLTQRLLPLLADGGRILNISSGLTRFSYPGYAAYAAMKGGVEVLTRYLAKELGARRISVNTVAPGAIATDFNGGAVRDTPQLNAQLASITALGRVGLPDDIGGAVAHLLATDAGWITGQRIEISGGMML